MPTPSPGGEVVVYEGSPIEQVGVGELVARKPELLVLGAEQVYLAGKVVVGDYGVAGCLVVDAHPEQRLVSYETDRDGWYPSHPSSYEEFVKDAEHNHLSLEANMGTFGGGGLDFHDPEHFARFVGTAGGFKLVRVFLTPAERAAQIDGLGKFVGPALRQECFNGDDMPKIPNEEHMTYWPGQDSHDATENSRFGTLLQDKLGHLEVALDLGPTSRDHYVSFHGWPWHAQIMDLAQESLNAAIARVDQLIGNFDRQQTIARRGLGELANGDTQLLETPEQPED